MSAEQQYTHDPTGRHDPRPKGYDKKDPWKYILPDREALAVNLTAQFKAINRPHVVAIHSEWGSGKTLFQIAWQDWLTHCQEDGKSLPYFYFNAWAKGSSLRDVNQALSSISLLSYADGMDAITFIECARSIMNFFDRDKQHATLMYCSLIGPRYNAFSSGLQGTYARITDTLIERGQDAGKYLPEDDLCELANALDKPGYDLLFCALVKSWLSCGKISFHDRMPPYLNFLKKIAYQAD